MVKPYVGITGPVNVDEVHSLLDSFESFGYNLDSSHIPMLGFLVSYKTLNGLNTKNRRYPEFSKLRKLIEPTKDKAFSMVHYNSRESNLSGQMEKVFENLYRENICRAVQLNIVYPDKKELSKIKNNLPDLKIVFQLSERMIGGKSTASIGEMVKAYEENIDYVLIDPSGGKGKEFDLNSSIKIYNEIKKRSEKLMIGFAGGFTGPNVLERVNSLVSRLGDNLFSIDAEGGLRDKLSDNYGDDLLNLDKVNYYLEESSRIL